MNTPDTGDHQLDNFLVPTGTTPPATCLPSNPTCTTNPVPAPGRDQDRGPGLDHTGQRRLTLVTYTLTFSNAAGKAPATVNYTDDLTKVLDDATVTAPPATLSGLTIGPITGGTFTVTGTLAAGATAGVTFSVKVNAPDTGNHRLDNFVVPTGTTPPATCLPVKRWRAPLTPCPRWSSPRPWFRSRPHRWPRARSSSTPSRSPTPPAKHRPRSTHTDDLSGVLDDATVTTRTDPGDRNRFGGVTDQRRNVHRHRHPRARRHRDRHPCRHRQHTRHR